MAAFDTPPASRAVSRERDTDRDDTASIAACERGFNAGRAQDHREYAELQNEMGRFAHELEVRVRSEWAAAEATFYERGYDDCRGRERSEMERCMSNIAEGALANETSLAQSVVQTEFMTVQRLRSAENRPEV